MSTRKCKNKLEPTKLAISNHGEYAINGDVPSESVVNGPDTSNTFCE